MIHTGREWEATFGMFRYWAKAATLVPSPTGAGYVQVALQIVTATLGRGLVPVLRTAIVNRVCCARRWCAGKVAVDMATGNLPWGSCAFWGEPPPHAAIPTAPIAMAVEMTMSLPAP